MTTAYSTLLGLALPVQGELSGVWGDTIDNGITRYLDIAVAGTVTLTNDGAVTLSLTNGDSTATNIVSSLTGAGTTSAQFAIIRVTGTLTVAKVLTAPSSSRTYVVVNAATGSTVTVKASGQTGVSIAVGETAFVYFNGTDYVKIVGTSTAGAAGGSTTQVQYNNAGVLAGITGATTNGTSLTLVAPVLGTPASGTVTNLTGTASININGTVGATTATTGAFTTLAASSTVTLSGGTANGVAYLDASKVLTTGTALVFDGTNFGVGGGTLDGRVSAYVTDGIAKAITARRSTSAAFGIDFNSADLNLRSQNVFAFTVGTANDLSGGSEGMRLTTTGLGIGTSSPGAKLVVNGSGNIVRFGDGTNTFDIRFQGPNNWTQQLNTTTDVFSFQRNSSDLVAITSGGNFGVGTSSPVAKLQSTGGVLVSGAVAALTANSGAMDFSGGYTRFIATGTDASTQGAFEFSTSSSNASVFNSRLILDSAGNLGLGVTPSASNLATIQSDYGIFSGNSGINIAQNAYFNSSWKYTATAVATRYAQSAGLHYWYNAPSGTAGNAISFTQAMTLDASGNLGVGTTTARVRLEVAGNIEIANTAVDGVADALIGGLQAMPRTSVANATFASANIQFRTDPTLYYKGVITFGTSGDFSSAAPTERARIDSDGTFRVKGAGTAGSTDAFQVAGTAPADAARIDSSGNLLVGTTTASATFTAVSGSASVKAGVFNVNAASSTGIPAIRCVKYDNDTTTSNKFIEFEINQGAAGSGQINANGANAAAFGSYSDFRLKENIIDLPPQLANIMALRPTEFDYIKSVGGGHQIGFIAQEMQLVYPDVVGEDANGMLTLTGWSKTEARLVKAIQEQQAIIESLKARLDAANL